MRLVVVCTLTFCESNLTNSIIIRLDLVRVTAEVFKDRVSQRDLPVPEINQTRRIQSAIKTTTVLRYHLLIAELAIFAARF
ncbi:hypothetical protein ACVIDN_003109 [Rhizobium brockwellii]